MSPTFDRSRSLRLNRRAALALGGGVTLGAVAGHSPERIRAQEPVEMTDFPQAINAFAQANPDLRYQQGLFVYNAAQRRTSVVNGVDVFSGLEEQWLGGGNANFIRPNQGTTLDLSWDMVVYPTVDSFSDNGSADLYLQNCNATMAPYNPTELILPEGMAASDFASTISYPFQSDPDITIYRTQAGFRKRGDAVTIIIDSYGEPLPDADLIALIDSLSNVLSDAYSDVGLMQGPVLDGDPVQADVLYRMYDGEFISHFGDEEEENIDRVQALRGLYAGSNHAVNVHWSGATLSDDVPQECFWTWIDFENGDDAQSFFDSYPDRIAATDLVNGLARSPFEVSLDAPEGLQATYQQLHIDLGNGQAYPGSGLLVLSGTNIWDVSLINPQPVDLPVSDADDPELLAQQIYAEFLAPVIDGSGQSLPLRMGVRVTSE